MIPFRFAVSQFTTQPWTFEEDVARYAQLGVAAIEVCEAKLDPDRIEAQMRLIGEAGLAISAVQPRVRTFGASAMQPEPHDPAERLSRLHRSIRTLAPYARGAPFVVNTGAAPGGDIAAMTRRTVDALGDTARLALEEGVTIALEPLNPAAMNSETAIWTVAQALDILDAVDSPAAGLCLDLWNVWQEAEIETAIGRAGPRILVLQASDWRVPRSGGDRLVPGDGVIPLGELLRSTAAAGYLGPCAVEIFSSVPDSLYDGDLAAVIRRSRDGLERAWNGAEAARAA